MINCNRLATSYSHLTIKNIKHVLHLNPIRWTVHMNTGNTITLPRGYTTKHLWTSTHNIRHKLTLSTG